MDYRTLENVMKNLRNITIAVVGDYFLDRYFVIDPVKNETSLETGLTAYQVVGKRLSAGAAGTVTNNLTALGIGSVIAVGIIGDDGEGLELTKALEATGVCTEYLIKSPERVTPTYTKPMLKKPEGEEEINRFDIKNWSTTPESLEKAIISRLYDLAEKVDAIIALDQVWEENCGVITANVREALAKIAENSKLVVYADSRAFSGRFNNVIIKCNEHELLKAVSSKKEGEVTEDELKSYGLAMYDLTGKPVFMTRGEKGICVFDKNEVYEIPAFKVDGPVDICGAGDAATAGIVSALCSGMGLDEAALLGNLVSSITIQQLGTTGTASPEQILKRYEEYVEQQKNRKGHA